MVPGERTIYEQMEDAGGPALLLETYAGRLEYHAPWHEGREVSHGRTLRVQTIGEGPPRTVDSFAVGLRAHQGDYLAVESSSISAMRCEGGDTEQLLFQPPLQPFGAWEQSETFDDCTLLVQATITAPRKGKRRR